MFAQRGECSLMRIDDRATCNMRMRRKSLALKFAVLKLNTLLLDE